MNRAANDTLSLRLKPSTMADHNVGDPNKPRPVRVLMVCLGNICRSPMAEGIFRHILGADATHWHIDSAGTSAFHVGERPDERAIDTLAQRGIDIRNQRSRQFTPSDLEVFDYILTMDMQNLRDVRGLANGKEQVERIRLLSEYSYPNDNIEVPDPYYGGRNGFVQVADLIESSCLAFIKAVQP